MNAHPFILQLITILSQSIGPLLTLPSGNDMILNDDGLKVFRVSLEISYHIVMTYFPVPLFDESVIIALSTTVNWLN